MTDGALLDVARQVMARDPDRIVGLAVSGGSDSMAMLHLFARVAPPARLAVATVDHRLRPGSAEEAAFVAHHCACYGIPHAVLDWRHGDIGGNLMGAARAARYGLIGDWARARGIGAVGVAHTADDQAETFLMGLSRAAGIDGLCGMRPEWAQAGTSFLRPLLDVPRQRLRDWLAGQGLDWRDDPSNDNDRFLRVRARRALRGLRAMGITAETMAASARNLATLRDMANRAAQAAFVAMGAEVAGALILSRAGWAATDPELRRRLLVAALRWMAGLDHPPRADAVSRLIAALDAGRDATLSGCRFRIAGDAIRMLREPRALGPATTGALWDDRWLVEGGLATGEEIRALGPDGLRALPDWRAVGLPRDVLLATPAIWRGPDLVAASLAGKPDHRRAKIARPFAAFILSH